MRRLEILDTTLRDGEQTPGVYFTKKEKLETARMLDRLGVDIIEAGIPAMGRDEACCMEALLGLGLRAEILAWNRLSVKDVEQSAACGVRHIHVAAPASDLHIRKKLNKSREWVLYNVQKIVGYCLDMGCTVSVGAEDASRADLAFVLKLFETAAAAGACRVRYADTVGVHDPFSAHEAIAALRARVGIDIDYHGHNDFGMSTANAFAAFKAGADVISCSVNGLGERAGNTPLEEIVMAVRHLGGGDVRIDTRLLTGASALVERFSRRPVPDGKAVVGRQVHTHESGIHVDGLLKHEATYQPYPPEEAGGKRGIVLGKCSGRRAIEHVYKANGRPLSPEQVDRVFARLKKRYS